MKVRLVLLLLIVFAAGVVFGIWLNWKHQIGGRQIVFQLQNYNSANLEVVDGDSVSLETPAGNSTGLQMGFVGGLSPCSTWKDGATCIIGKNPANRPYFFTCSGSGYSCSDPALQQSSTTPIGFSDTVKMDIFGDQFAPQQKKQPPPVTTDHAAASSVIAIPACNTSVTPNITEVLDRNNNPLNPIPATSNESVFWTSSVPFSIDTSKFPSNFCTNGNPSGSNLIEAECDIAQYKGSITLTYTVQSQTSPNACPALTTAQLKVN